MIFQPSCPQPYNCQMQTEVLVVSGQKTMFNERLKLCGELWSSGIKVSFEHRCGSLAHHLFRRPRQFSRKTQSSLINSSNVSSIRSLSVCYLLDIWPPLVHSTSAAVIIGDGELEAGVVKVAFSLEYHATVSCPPCRYERLPRALSTLCRETRCRPSFASCWPKSRPPLDLFASSWRYGQENNEVHHNITLLSIYP